MAILEPVIVETSNGKATIFPAYKPEEIPTPLFQQMMDLLNYEIIKGDTYPKEHPFETLEEFGQYWLSHFCAVFVEGTPETLLKATDLIGTFYIRPNYPDRCSHVCNAGFLVNPEKRGRRAGVTLGKQYVEWAPLLGYEYSVFNLVFVTNPASIRIWEQLGFDRIGLIKGAGRLKGHKERVDAIMFGKSFLEAS